MKISGLDSLSCEDIMTVIAHKVGMEFDETDISTVHPIPTYGEGKGDESIVTFTPRAIHNGFLGSQKKVSGKKASKLATFKNTDLSDEIYMHFIIINTKSEIPPRSYQ